MMDVVAYLQKYYADFEWLALMRLLKKLAFTTDHYIFKSAVSMAFPACELADFAVDAQYVYITANFLGLQGVATPLPLYFSEAVVDAVDTLTLNAFFDFFNHHFYQALLAIDQKYHYSAQVNPGYQDVLTQNLWALTGLPSVEDHLYQQLLPGLCYFVGGRVSKQGLCWFLQKLYQDARVCLKERVKKKVFIPPEQQSVLGVNSILKRTVILGAYVVQANGHFELHIDVKAIRNFLPGTKNFILLQNILEVVINVPVAITLVLHTQQISLPQLRRPANLALGYDTALVADADYSYELKFALS
jgi:type VI secretion system protein ImpH